MDGWERPLGGDAGGYVSLHRVFRRTVRHHLPSKLARFSFAQENRAFIVAACSSSPLVRVTINGELVSRRPFALNQHSMKIAVDKLEYRLQYTDFASTSNFREQRISYLASHDKSLPNLDYEIPTPSPGQRTYGQWTLLQPIGKGSFGRVFLASNKDNKVVAMKVLERTHLTVEMVNAEVAISRQITALAQRCDDQTARRLGRARRLGPTRACQRSRQHHVHQAGGDAAMAV